MNTKTVPEFAIHLEESHPVRKYIEENTLIANILVQLEDADPLSDFPHFFNVFNQLCEVDKHYTRKENQLFPYLEKHGWNGPSQGMWAFHDANRDLLRNVRKKIETRQFSDIRSTIPVILEEFSRMIFIEETRLLPHSLQLLTRNDWQAIERSDEEIGWMTGVKLSQGSEHEPQANKDLPFSVEGRIRVDEGYLTTEQLNLMLKFMPIDLTFVDENDRVVFYNRGEDRVFPRSAGVIGREVKFCHPPKSVGTVLRILEEFKKGTKDQAEFWIKFRGKVIHIRYFAIRDNQKNYKGVIELSQDITEIQKLEGEQRLLSWDEHNEQA